MLSPHSASLIPRVIARNARRCRVARSALTPFTSSREEAEALRALAATTRRLRGVERAEFYLSPETRGWLSAVEEAMDLARPVERDLALFDRVARGPYLAELVPGGRIDSAFRRRARRLGARLVRRSLQGIPPVIAFLTPSRDRFGPFRLDTDADGYEARRSGEIHLRFPLPTTLRVRPGARLELVDGGMRVRQSGPPADWRPRPLIEGTAIAVGRRVLSSRRGLRAGAMVAALPDRLGGALRLVRDAWPEMHEEVLLHTWDVIPLVERGTVSYSLPSRPGTSYINVEGKRPVDLADDLVHETAHHRLHGHEELAPLYRGGEEAVYYSPWRGAMRPLRGILHASYTFAFRAELFRRMQRLPGRLPRAWMAREARREVDRIRRSLVDLEDALDRGRLTTAGTALLEELARFARRGRMTSR